MVDVFRVKDNNPYYKLMYVVDDTLYIEDKDENVHTFTLKRDSLTNKLDSSIIKYEREIDKETETVKSNVVIVPKEKDFKEEVIAINKEKTSEMKNEDYAIGFLLVFISIVTIIRFIKFHHDRTR